MSQYEHIRVERSEGLGVLTLDREDRLNALSLPMVAELHRALDELADDLETRVVILTGAGRAFCAGTDLRDELEHEASLGHVQSTYRLQQRVAGLSVKLRDIPQPVIAAVHGHAVGGGLSLATACDIRIADDTARFSAAFIKIGLSGGDLGVSWFLPRIVGASAAAEVMYTGRTITPQEALQLGLVSRAVAEGQDVHAARMLAQDILGNSPFGVRMTKELLNVSLDAPGLRHSIELENRTQVLCLMTEDFAEGKASFVERRRADYQDR